MRLLYVLQNDVKMQILIRRHLNTTGTTGTTKDSCAHMTCAAHMTSQRLMPFFSTHQDGEQQTSSLGDKTMGSWIGSITLLPRQGVKVAPQKTHHKKK